MKIKVVTAVVTLVGYLSYFAWGYFTSPAGDQKVDYVPAIKTCFNETTPVTWTYCVHIPKNEPINGDIAYLLHGRNLDENIWNDNTFYTSMIQSYWQKMKVPQPTVITVSFGPLWLLTQKGIQEKSGLLEVFADHIIPKIEAKVGQPKRRILFGESMGGTNALVLGIKRNDLFDKVASLCPGVYKDSLFASSKIKKDFLNRTGADPKVIYAITQFAKDYIANDQEWNQFSVLKLIESVSNVKTQFYLSCGLYDKYGNFEGTEELASLVAKKSIGLQWHPQYGGHCSTDIALVAQFLVL